MAAATTMITKRMKTRTMILWNGKSISFGVGVGVEVAVDVGELGCVLHVMMYEIMSLMSSSNSGPPKSLGKRVVRKLLGSNGHC